MSQINKTATMLEDKIRAAFDEVSQRHTRPRKLIADRLVELAVSGENFTIDRTLAGDARVRPTSGKSYSISLSREAGYYGSAGSS